MISDTPTATDLAIAAVNNSGTLGCIGLHLEGPHIAQAKKGAHDPSMTRSMSAEDQSILAQSGLQTLMVTLAPECVSIAQIKALSDAGIIVSLGHSDCTFAQALDATNSGATGVTHLFNAMNQLGHRSRGLVGTALQDGRFSAGLIADGFHVDPNAIAIALRAKQGPGHIFLVSDAMALVGSSNDTFALNGRTVRRINGRLELKDRTLAGSDLTMISAIKYMVKTVGLPLIETLRMATIYPARTIKRPNELGSFSKGARADIVHCSDDLMVQKVWQAGREINQ